MVGNLEGDHLVGSHLALEAIRYLVGNAADEAVQAALSDHVFYVFPRLNPDGAEAMFAAVKWGRKTNALPFDDDNDGRTDEDGPEDLNGDGYVTVMRVADPTGCYMIDPADAAHDEASRRHQEGDGRLHPVLGGDRRRRGRFHQ